MVGRGVGVGHVVLLIALLGLLLSVGIVRIVGGFRKLSEGLVCLRPIVALIRGRRESGIRRVGGVLLLLLLLGCLLLLPTVLSARRVSLLIPLLDRKSVV